MLLGRGERAGTHLEFCVTSFSWLRCCAAASRPVCKLTSSGPSSSLLSPAILRALGRQDGPNYSTMVYKWFDFAAQTRH